MKRIDVRCCCTPGKVLGSVPVPDSTKPGERVRLIVMKPRTHIAPTQTAIGAPRYVELAVESFVDHSGGHPKYGMAVQSERGDIETLRRIPGFIEERT